MIKWKACGHGRGLFQASSTALAWNNQESQSPGSVSTPELPKYTPFNHIMNVTLEGCGAQQFIL
jgi:hypothetical protein